VRLCLCCLILLIVSQGVFAAGPGDARITGHIICADTGQPARFATVILQPVPADNAKLDMDRLPVSSSTVTGDDGTFAFDSIPAGRYVVGAELEGYVSPLVTASADKLTNDDPAAFSAVIRHMTPVFVDASSTANADIRLERGAALSGTVSYDDGSPSIQATVELLRKTKDGSMHGVALSSLELLFRGTASPKTDDLGHFRIAGLPPGDYVLRVSLPKPVAAFSGFSVNKIRMSQTPENLPRLRLYSGNSFRMRDAKVVHANGGEEITGLDFIFPLSTLHRVSAVLSSASGTLPKGAQVSLLFADNQEVLDTADPDAETHAVFFSSVPEGTYLLQVKASGNKGALASAVLSVPILVNTDRQNVPLNLP
jgi:Carboxypeptidase regulatory-like domain